MSPSPETRAEVAHLLGRAGFGVRAEEVDAAAAAGYEPTVERLLRPPADAGAARTPPPRLAAPPERPGRAADGAARGAYRRALRAQMVTVTRWWLDRMVAAEQPFTEKLTLVWHGHFATSAQKVRVAGLMLRQNESLRRLGRGDFAVLADAMVRDPAMLVWLDGRRNTRKAPNENLARELMELFVLGHDPRAEAYTEPDVQAAARALTGWTVDVRTGTARVVPARRDPRPQTILGRTATFDAGSLVDLLVAQPASPRFLATRLWQRFARPEPPPADALARLVGAYGPGRDLTALLRALFTDPAFRGQAARRTLVKQPVEWLVGAHRTLGVPLESLDRGEAATERAGVERAGGAHPAVAALRALGQLPFYPPSVGGWPSGTAWLSTAATRTRLGYARRLAAAADLSAVATAAPLERPDAVAELLGLEPFSARTRTALARVAPRPADVVTLALASPEYLVH